MAQYNPKTWVTGEVIEAAELNALEQAAAGAAVVADAGTAGTPTGDALRVAFDTAGSTAELLALFTAGSKAIRLHPGTTFTISAPLVPPTGTRIVGDGASIQANSATGTLLSAGHHFDLTNDDVTISGITFIAPTAPLTLGSGEDAVVHSAGARNKVVGCRFLSTGVDAAVFVKGPATDNLIADNDVTGSRIIYSYAGASRTTCRGNRLQDSPSRALNGVNNGGTGVWNTDCMVADNVIINSAGMGIEDSGWGTVIRDNRIVNPADMGISAVGVLALVQGNTITSPGSVGIEAGSSGTKILANDVLDDTGTEVGIMVNAHNTGSVHRGAVIEGNRLSGWLTCVQAYASDYAAVTITTNTFQDWQGSAVAVGPIGLGAVVVGNVFIQTVPGGSGVTRFGVSLEAPCTVTGNRFIYAASATGPGFEVAVRPAPGSDGSQILGNVVDGGGLSPAVAVVATNGADPAGIVIAHNTAMNGSMLDFGFMVSPQAFGNSGPLNNAYNMHWSAFYVDPIVRPTITGSRAGEPASTASLRTALTSLGLVIDNTTS